MAALEPENRQEVQAVRDQSGQYVLDVFSRGVDLGVFTVADPWLAAAAIGAIGMRVAEWWTDELGYEIDEVVSTYSNYALRILMNS